MIHGSSMGRAEGKTCLAEGITGAESGAGKVLVSEPVRLEQSGQEDECGVG